MRDDTRDVHSSDEHLMERLCNGDESVLNILMERHQQALYHFILRYTSDEHLSFDIVQESFVRVFTRATSFNQKYRFKTWLYQISLNLCRDHGRKNSLRRLFSFDEAKQKRTVQVEPVSSIEKDNETKEEIRVLRKHISELPHKLKSALLLFSLQEKSQLEAAKILGVSPKTVETRVYRAKKILRKKMQI